MLAVVVAVILQQAATGQVVWQTPASPTPEVTSTTATAPDLPDWARADPYGYERSECSPLLRTADETMEACQSRVRRALAAHPGAALPVGLSAGGADEPCRQAAAGDRYALQCGTPSRSMAAGPDLRDRSCVTRPSVTARGTVSFEDVCTVGGQEVREEGLKIRLGGND